MKCEKHDKPMNMIPLSSYFNNITLAHVCLSCGEIIKDVENIGLFRNLLIKQTPYERK